MRREKRLTESALQASQAGPHRTRICDGVFEEFCREREFELFVLPPRSPKLNGCVERIQRTFDEEFYQCTDADARVEPLAAALREYEVIYNTIRPHQALGYQTPREYLTESLQEAA